MRLLHQLYFNNGVGFEVNFEPNLVECHELRNLLLMYIHNSLVRAYA
jgi:hypothetical protein